MPSEPITLASILKIIWAPILGVLVFFSRKVITDMDKRIEKLEQKCENISSKDETRQTIKDLMAPIEVKQNIIKGDIMEIKDHLKQIKEKL